MNTEGFDSENNQMDDDLKTEQDSFLSSADLKSLDETNSVEASDTAPGVNSQMPINAQAPMDTLRGISKKNSESHIASNQYEPGDLIRNRYKIVRVIGSGGFGVVYEASDTAVHDQRVAVKTLKHNIADYELAAQRFQREIELCGSIRSRNVVKILDSGTADDETLFYVMEFLEGQTLEDLLAQHERLSFFDVKNILLQALDAISEAHFKNIVHRDLKPSNIWLKNKSSEEHDFEVKILDFGIAKSLDPNQEKAHKLTQTGAWMGSPAYMSPEHLAGSRELTPAADIFSLGLIAIEMLTGYPAIEGDSPMEVALSIASPEEIVIDDWILDSSIGNIIERCVRKNPKDRYQNGDSLICALRSVDDTTLKNEYAAAKMRKRVGRRSTTLSTAGAINTQIGLSPELKKANRETKIQIALIAGIILCLFAVGIFYVVRKYTENNFMKPISDEQREAFQSQMDKNIQELVAAQMKIENSKRFIGLRMGTGMKQGAVWGAFCDDTCIQNHAEGHVKPQQPQENTDNSLPPIVIPQPENVDISAQKPGSKPPKPDSGNFAPPTDKGADKNTKNPTDSAAGTKQPLLVDNEPAPQNKDTKPEDKAQTKQSSNSKTSSKSSSKSSGSSSNSKKGKNTSSKPSIDWKVNDL